jgi:hypothetical protein
MQLHEFAVLLHYLVAKGLALSAASVFSDKPEPSLARIPLVKKQ